MDTHHDEAAVRKEAYLLWEKDGKPEGRDTEYWMRAKVLVAEKTDMDAVSKPAPKSAARPKSATPRSKAAPVKTAASEARAEPSKATKAGPAKPKKK